MSRPRPRRTAWAGPLGLHRPGTTAVHRAPAGLKLAVLAVLGLVVTLLGSATTASLALLGVVAVALWAQVPLRATVRALAPVLLVAVALAAYQTWQRGPAVAAEVSGTLVALVLAAVVVTTTTPADRMLATLVRVVRPLRRIGVDPETVALAIALMLRTVPALLLVAQESRDAARARGLERSPRALLVPFAVRTVARAHATGDALAARGIGD